MSIHRNPHFLDVFLPNLTSNRLKVPSKFIHHLSDQTSGSVSLIGPSGNEWQVKLFEYDGHLFFHEGWPTFVKDHAIQCGDTLVFGYDGSSKFTVQIFDESSCEKDEAFLANCSQRNYSQRASESAEILRKRRERDIEAAFLKLVAEKKMRVSWVPDPQESMITVPSGDDIKPEKIVEASERMVVLATPALTQTDIEMLKLQDNRVASKVKTSGKKKQNKKNSDNDEVPSISKFIKSKAAQYFTSSFPYFVRVMYSSNIKSCMKIPTHFSRLHLPNMRIRVTLMNLNGDSWIVTSIPTFRRSSVMHTLSGGWTAFVRDNNIKVEDVCIFELVSEFALRIHILRMGVEGLEFEHESQSIVDNGAGFDERCLEMIENGTQDTGVHPSRVFDEANEPYVQQEAVSSIDFVDHISVSSIGTGDDSTSEELLLRCHDGGKSILSNK